LSNQSPTIALKLFQGKWDRKSFTGIEMNGKTLGIIGCGRIGLEVAKCAKEMGMVVLGYDPVMTAEAFREAGLQRAELDEIYRRSDFITVHTPLTPETNNLLNEKTLMQCKRGMSLLVYTCEFDLSAV
jgi:D-3-phosphoglycerate dehydrogenase